MKKVIFFTILFLFILFFYTLIPTEGTKGTALVEIKKGESIKTIAKKLEERGVIKNWVVFYVYSLLRDKTLKYGYYEFEGRLSIKDIWERLYKGKEKLFKFTIFPGDDMLDIAERLDSKGFVKKEEFIAYVFNRENIKNFNLEGDSFEGYFPPETYFLRKSYSVREIVQVFLKEFKRRYSPFEKGFKEGKISFYEAMIIASLIEKETFIEKEKPIIAGVILNRLKKGMYLQIDPTVIYALKLKGQWNGNLTKENMKVNSPYNTYINYGLPPTPICSFSVSSLKAVLKPLDTDYLYYVFDGEKHIFSRDYKTHQKNIRKILEKW